MRTFKIIAAFGALLLVASSCNMFVKRDALESSQAETREARKALEQTQKNYAEQNEELCSILGELTELSRQTSVLQLQEDEGGERRLTQADQIDQKLTLLKERIEQLEKDAARARKLNKDLAIAAKTIASLRETVENQQNEINTLRSTLVEREETIAVQSSVISDQKDSLLRQESTIERQSQDLEATLRQQTELIFQAGLEFEKLGDEADSRLDVFGRKDKGKVKEFKRAIYSKAFEYYRVAASQDHESALQRAKAVQEKINNL